MTPRDATPADLPVLARILGDWARETGWMPLLHSREDDLGFLSHLHASGVLRTLGDPPLGFLARRGAEIDALYLAPQARGRGLGRRLLAEAMAAESRLVLWTFQANAPARAFYARMGFVEVARTDGAATDEGLPDVQLEWRRG